MPKVIAIRSFDHGGSRRRGDVFTVSPQVAEQLRLAGLVRVEGGPASADPRKAAGALSSASPAARASRRQTAKSSNGGETAPRAEA